MRGTDKLNICETFYIYVGQWRTGRSRVCVTLQSSRNGKITSIGSRSILVRFSIGSRSSFVRPSFCLRSSFVRQSKIYRRTIEDLSKKQRKHNGATREQLKSGNEHATSMKRTTIEWGALRCAQCWIIRYAQCWMWNVECWMVAVGNVEFWMLSVELCALRIRNCSIRNCELRILNSKFTIQHRQSRQFNIQHSNQSLRKMSRV